MRLKKIADAALGGISTGGVKPAALSKWLRAVLRFYSAPVRQHFNYISPQDYKSSVILGWIIERKSYKKEISIVIRKCCNPDISSLNQT